MQLSNSDIQILHTKPSRTRLNLSIFQPRIIMRCQINNPSIKKGDRIIPYNSVTLGNYSSVESGFTLYIGTTVGAHDVGKLRIRSVDANQFILSENSNIQWTDRLYLTVLRYVDIWPIYPQIIQNPSNPVDVIFYKDYDIAYTNQNSILGTFINMGPHQAEYLDGGLAQIYYTATGTYNLLGSALSFDWAFEGGTPTGSNLFTPGWISYNTAGQYVTRLIVSGSNGSVDTAYRYVSIYDRPQNGPNTTPQRWNLTKLDGSRSEGGYTATIQLYNPIGDIVEGACVVISSEDWYGNVPVSLGGNAQNAQNTFFVGYILDDTIHWQYDYSYVEFNIGSVTEVMKKSLGFAIDVESKVNPTTWYQLKDLDVRRSIYHYLKWHTTVLSITDFQFLGQDYPIQYFDSNRESMFDAIDNLMRGTLIGQIVSDRQGKVWAEINAEATPNATGTFTQDMTITKSDWMNQPTLSEQINNPYSYLEYGGIAYSGPSTGTFTPLLACAPGNAPSFRGAVQNQEGLAVASQVQLNQLVGNLLANRNTRYPNVTMELAGKYSNLDIAPQDTSRIIIAPSDTSRNVNLDMLGITDSMSWAFDSTGQFLRPTTIFKTVVSGPSGDSIIIPVNPADTSQNFGGGFSIPNFVIPPIIFNTGTTTVPNLVKGYALDGTSHISPYNISGWFIAPPPSGNPSGTYNPSPIFSVASNGISIPAGYYYISGWVRLSFNLSAITTTGMILYLTYGGGSQFVDTPDRDELRYGIEPTAPTVTGELKVAGIYYFSNPTIIGLAVLLGGGSPTVTQTVASLSIFKLA